MNRILLALLLAALPAAAQNQEANDRVQKVVQLKYADANSVQMLLMNFGVEIRSDARMKILTLAGKRSAVATAEDAIKQLDIPAAAQKDIEMTAFFDKWRDAQGYFDPGGTPAADFAVVPPATRERRAADAAIECIGCGICYSACDVVAWDRDYLGPAALNRAWTLVNDVRDTARKTRLEAVGGDGGCQCCHTHMSCTSFCPKGIAPTYSIAGLKRTMLWQALGAYSGEVAPVRR